MQTKTVWQMGSADPNNANHFAIIRDWWSNLNGSEVSWKQRLLQPSQTPQDLNWDWQRFDESFAIAQPQVRGITLYWQKPGTPDERNTTPHRLELDHLHQQLYIFPQSQKEVVIQIAIPQVVYQIVDLSQPSVTYTAIASGGVLMLKDESQHLEIRAILTATQLNQLKQQLG